MALLSNSTGQIEVTFLPITSGHTADVQALTVLPGVTGGRRIMGQLYVDVAGTTPVRLDFTIAFNDLAFEEFDVFGGHLTPQDRQKLSQRF